MSCFYNSLSNLMLRVIIWSLSSSFCSSSPSPASLSSPPASLLSSTQTSQVNILVNRLQPTIQIAIPVHPYTKAKVLPYTLSAIQKQNYPKNRIRIYFFLELYENLVEGPSKIYQLSDERFTRNLISYQAIKSWIAANKVDYNDIQLDINYIDDSVDPVDDSEYWSIQRFRKIIKLKTNAIQNALANWADYLLLMDCDVILVNNGTISSLVEENQPLVSPMLYSLGTYSNFWAGMDDKGYYVRTEDYLPILERHKMGLFRVPMVHSCILVDLNVEQVNSLTFNGSKLDGAPYDDIIAFALSARYAGLPMFTSNKQIWGYIMPPTEKIDLRTVDQDLIDLHLESSVDGHSFPIVQSMFPFTGFLPSESNKLGVDEVYVINLERRKERLKRVSERLKILGIDAKIWPAVDGKEISEDFLLQNNITTLPGYLDPYHQRPITYGEMGCFLSHYQIWRDMLSKNYSSAIIFEDDVKFERAFRQRWEKRLEILRAYQTKGNQIDLVYLGRKPQGSKEEEKPAIDGFIYPKYSYWTIGYMLTATGAEKLIDAKPLEKLLPIDEYLPIMYNQHPVDNWSKHFPTRNLIALSVHPLLVSPSHYVGDEQYISDTEDSNLLTGLLNSHSKHFEL